MTRLDNGDPAPDFELEGPQGPVRLSDYRNVKPVVLYFYPKDGTPVCTRQACAFRDAYEDFVAAGAEVIGVSADSAGDHDAFSSQHRLPFVLASDPGGRVARDYGVSKTLGLMPGRVTFVIDSAGVIRHSFSSQLAAQRHVDEALAALRRAEG